MAALYISIVIIAVYLLSRYLPVNGIQNVKWTEINLDEVTILDVRDFNESYKSSLHGAVNIPVAYLNRSLKELPLKEIHLVAASTLEKNISARLLRKKGYRVSSYTLLPTNYSSPKENGIEIETS
ncbi:rhodanese-like domain-containing protein [Bacillus marasmi]|uniref:rhodanese-like domain-containing protein n=1 Tax=Bacillus marasmi TaxID=1926279 RepID=UPI0011CA7158|nr:rhodanese-like domain-containing protein [Bacillus marasmi]